MWRRRGIEMLEGGSINRINFRMFELRKFLRKVGYGEN